MREDHTINLMKIPQLIQQLVTEGGAIVSSNDCSEMELADARATGRFSVDDDGMGYVRRTKGWLALQKSRETPVYAVPANNHGFFVVSSKVPSDLLRDVMETLVSSDRQFNTADL